MIAFHQRDYWIFDMDGTLTLSIHDFEAMRQELGLPSGQPILESLAQMSEAEAAPIRQQLAVIELDIARRSTPQPGAIALLENLRRRGKPIGLLTRNSKVGAYETLAACGLLDFFAPEVILSRDCCAPKPSPDGIHKLLDHWQTTPEQTVMVGDYVFDLQTGRQAGTATVHLDPSGNFRWPEWADLQITHLDELAQVLIA